MNLKTAASAILLSFSAASAANESQPHRIRYEALIANPLHTENSSILIDSLSKEGIISVTDIPGFGELKNGLMTHLHACMMDQGDDVPHHVFQDGTVRRTLATVTLPGGVAQPMKSASSAAAESQSCQKFNQHLDSFRAKVDAATTAFAERLSFEMGSSLPKPLMSSEDGSKDFDDIKDVVAAGEHLEHFHSYQKPKGSKNSFRETIELHADQGFFISFSPGLLVSHKFNQRTPDFSEPLVPSDGFYIENSEGHRTLLQFDIEDDLVFMMGDGVNQ